MLPRKEVCINKEEVGLEVLKISPGIGGVGMTFLGMPLPDVLTLATITYVGILILYKLWSWYTEYKEKEKKDGV